MRVLYDARTAADRRPPDVHWGQDPQSIRYAAVSSCLSVTLVYDDALVGGHFALFRDEAGNMTPLTQVNWTLHHMMGLRPNAKVRRALLIGCTGTWLAGHSVVYKYIKKFCVSVDPKYHHEEKWETPEHPAQCDIIVHRTGQVFFTYTMNSPQKGQPLSQETFRLD
jgi:hypothetical protein